MEMKERTSFGIRHLQCLLLFVGLAVGYAMRVNLSVAIVVMTDRNASELLSFETFDWTELTKSYVLSSFFWGYIITQVPAGYLADKYGPKSILLYGTLVSSFFAIFTPLCVHYGDWQLLCLLRLVQGLSQGMLFPSTHAILSKWALEEERGSFCGFCYAGTLFGAAVTLAISGFLASSCLGWPGIFYVSGSVGFGWTLFWHIWGANTPRDYEGLGEAEKQLLESSFSEMDPKKQIKRQTSDIRPPWIEIFKSPAVWVLTFVHCAHTWGFWTLLTELPTYMKAILHTDIQRNALLTAAPYLAMLLLSFVFIYISNMLAKERFVSTAINRKFLNTIGQWIPAFGLVLLSYVKPEDLNEAIFLLILVVGMNAASFSGFQVNHIDLSPNYAGVLMGITNSPANVMSVLAPLLVGVLVTDENDPEQWRIIFFVAAGFYFLGNLLFVLFGSAEVQKWNDQNGENQIKTIEMQNLTASV